VYIYILLRKHGLLWGIIPFYKKLAEMSVEVFVVGPSESVLFSTPIPAGEPRMLLLLLRILFYSETLCDSWT